MYEKVKERALLGALAGVVASALIATAIPSMAFADAKTVAGETVVGNTDSTQVYLQADDGTLSVSAPTEIHVMVKADGTFVTPSAETTQIKNGSIFSVSVSKLAASAQGGFSLVKDASAATANDAVSYSIAPNKGTAVQVSEYVGGKAITDSAWSMTKKGSTGANLNLTTAGAINNITKDLQKDQHFTTLSWTFKAGANA